MCKAATKVKNTLQKQENNNKRKNRRPISTVLTRKNVDSASSVSDSDCEIISSLTTHKGSINFVNPFYINVIVNENLMKFQIDSGSPISAIPEKYLSKLSFLNKLKVVKTNNSFGTYIGEPVIVRGIIKVRIQHNEIKDKADLYVVSKGSEPILGRDWLKILNLESMFKLDVSTINTVENVDQLINKYPSVFSDKLGCYNKKKFKLHLKDEHVKPVFHRARPIPFAMKGAVSEEIDRLVEKGLFSTT